MKSIYVNNLKKGDVITDETFAVFESQKAEDKNGRPYYNVELGDKTGRIKGRIWSDSIANVETKALKEDKLVVVDAVIEEYRGTLQINIKKLHLVKDEKALEDFVQSSQLDPDEMMDEFKDEVEKLDDKEIKDMFGEMLADKEFVQKLKFYPAARSIHHDFRSGMLQHILEMIAAGKPLMRFYPEIDWNILFAGIVLHDIGKFEELDASSIKAKYTKRGSLLGHIFIGVKIFERYGGEKLPEDKYLHIANMILSHHGLLEYGSPVLPATPEAWMLTHLDKVSSKPRSAVKAVSEIPEGEEFNMFYRWLDNAHIWKGGDYGNKSLGSAEEATATAKKDTNSKKKKEENTEDQMNLI